MRDYVSQDEAVKVIEESVAVTLPTSTPKHTNAIASTEPFREIDGGVTAPKGFVAAGMYAGIRKVKKDLALIVSEMPAETAAVFTQSKTVAAPVVVDRLLFAENQKMRAILVNSGNANACTGERGMSDAWNMVRSAAASLGIQPNEVLISSTGVIGQYLPINKIVSSVPALAKQLSSNGSQDAAEAIMTTDTFAKSLAVQVEIGGKLVTIGGVAKGSGMIQPNMATMLAFLTSDVNIDQSLLQTCFARAVDKSFNRISVDGDTSTNDMAALMANGLAGNKKITERSHDLELFVAAMEHVLVKLAKMIARDGEGATKLVEIKVRGGKSEKEVVDAARAVANSNLVKTAIHGADANWGRIIAAVGYSGIDFDPANVQLWFDDLPILDKDYNILLDEEKAKEVFLKDNLTITIDLNQGPHEALFWTCDLTKEYIHINASYRS